MSQGHRKSQGQTKKMYSLLARKKYFFCRDKVKKHYLILITIYGSFHLLFDTICDPIYVPSNNVLRTERLEEMTVEDLDVLDDLISDLDDE